MTLSILLLDLSETRFNKLNDILNKSIKPSFLFTIFLRFKGLHIEKNSFILLEEFFPIISDNIERFSNLLIGINRFPEI